MAVGAVLGGLALGAAAFGGGMAVAGRARFVVTDQEEWEKWQKGQAEEFGSSPEKQQGGSDRRRVDS